MRFRIPCLIGLVVLAMMTHVPAGAAELGLPTDVSFRADVDGSTQNYVEMLPAPFDPAKHYDVLIVLHGYGSDRHQVEELRRPAVKALQTFATNHDMILISPDYRKNSFMGPKAEADMVQILSLLRQKHKVRRVFIAGGSMGGMSVLIFSALHPDLVAGVASLNGSANMMEFQVPATTPQLKELSEGLAAAMAASYGGTRAEKPEEYRKRSPEYTPEKFTMPIAFVVGAKDPLVPPDSIRRLVARLREMKKKDVLLIDRPEGGHEPSYDDTLASLEFILKEADAKENSARDNAGPR